MFYLIRVKLRNFFLLIPYAQIAGLALNGVQKKSEREEVQRRLDEMSDPKFKTIFDLLYKLNEKIDLFEKHGTDEIFECRILSVDEEFRGRGLANVLMKDSVETAKKAGFKVSLANLATKSTTKNCKND